MSGFMIFSFGFHQLNGLVDLFELELVSRHPQADVDGAELEAVLVDLVVGIDGCLTLIHWQFVIAASQI